ncbi:dethiobiotin synthase, partial [Xanthomonas oryzae pv. oryzae]
MRALCCAPSRQWRRGRRTRHMQPPAFYVTGTDTGIGKT